MPRAVRVDAGDHVFHVLNRANDRLRLFAAPEDYEAFEEVLGLALAKDGMRLLAYCIMPNHWHLVLWPRRDGDLARCMHAITMRHARRLRGFRRTAGQGHIYQGRYKSFLVDTDDYFLRVCRYVERNPLRAGLVKKAEDWAWSSLGRQAKPRPEPEVPLAPWPVTRPRNWRKLVNQPLTDEELAAVRLCIKRGSPYGGTPWVSEVSKRFGIESTLRPRGRPKATGS